MKSGSLQTFLLLLFVCCLGCAQSGYAFSFVSTQQYETVSSDSLDDEIWALSVTSLLHGVYADDVFLLSRDIEAGGTFADDLYCAAEKLSVTGSVGRDLRFFGVSTLIDCVVSGSVCGAGTTIKFGDSARIQDSVAVAAETIIFEGNVDGDFYAAATHLTIKGEIGGDLYAGASDIVLMAGTKIDGDIIYAKPGKLLVPRNVVVGGEVRKPLPGPQHTADRKGYWIGRFMTHAAFFFAATIVALPWMGLFPHMVGRTTHTVRKKFWKSCLTGFIAFFGIPLLALTALFTVLAAPLGILMLFGYGIMIYLGKIITALTVGLMIQQRNGRQKSTNVIGAALMGLFIFYVASLIPGFQISIWLAATIPGLGAILLSILTARHETIAVLPQDTAKQILQAQQANETDNKGE